MKTTSRHRWCAGLFRAAALTALSLGCGAPGPPERIVLIVVDTLRRDHLSSYGAEVRTPNIERLAQRGSVYHNAVASYHNTSMSMGALFTGRTPSLESGAPRRHVDWIPENWCGLARFIETAEKGCIPASLTTLGELMQQQGYWTVGIASNPITHEPAGFDRGFERWVEVKPGRRENLFVYSGKQEKRLLWAELRSGRRVSQAAIAALEERRSDHFFLYVHYMDVHDWHFRKVPYAETVELMDRALGDLLDYLEEEDLLDDAVVVLTADHGEALGEEHMLPSPPRHYGNPTFETVLRVPLIVVGAKLDREASIIRTEDLYRFLGRLTGAPALDPSQLASEELFLSEKIWRIYRRGRWKSFWSRADDAVRLVDLRDDPGESRDVAAQHPSLVAEHKRRLSELSSALAAPEAPAKELEPKHVELLRSLGYLP